MALPAGEELRSAKNVQIIDDSENITDNDTLQSFGWRNTIKLTDTWKVVADYSHNSAKRVERMKNFTRADQVAQFAVALASPITKDVTGQIFVTRGNEIFLMSQPRIVRGMAKVEGAEDEQY